MSVRVRLDRETRCGVRPIGRRAALELGLCVALAPGLALAQAEPARERPKESDLLVAVSSAATPEPLKPDDLPLGGKPTMAWPMDPQTNTVRNGSRLNKVLRFFADGAAKKWPPRGSLKGTAAFL
jgi:hypothetical protein